MKWFGRTGGYYMFWTGAVYLTCGLALIALGLNQYTTVVSPLWIVMLSLPFAIPPFGRWLNMDIVWDKVMFNWFNKDKTPSNVVPFPAPQIVPPAPPEPEKPAKIFYRIGVTDNNRVAFSMGQMEITMTALGVQNMIDQLEVFKKQISNESDYADSE